jgi:fructan beta-fructosidase
MDDRYRPSFHFTPANDWMSDPNGLLYLEGEYHLFYQYHTPRHWGHAVSTDLVHWTHLPTALFPDERGAIFSGGAVVDRDSTSAFFDDHSGLVAVFTQANTLRPPEGPQLQSIAYSRDRGRTWMTYEGNPVIANPGVADFRDPKVFWHEPTSRWVMIITFNGDRVRFYTSRDLKAWTFASEFGLGHGAHEGIWECPDLFTLPIDAEGRRKWVLHVSINDRGHERMGEQPCMQYFIGEFDGTSFTNDAPADTVRWSEYGRGNYAAVVWTDLPPADGRRILISWMNNWTYARHTPTSPWQGAMTVPQELRLRRCDGQVRLVQRPIVALRQLRRRELRLEDRALTPASALRVAEVGEALEIQVAFEPDAAASCGIRVYSSERCFTDIRYDGQAAILSVERSHSGATAFSPYYPGTRRAPLRPIEGRIQLHILVDRCSVEVFANDGEVAITSLIFPDDPPGMPAVEAYAHRGDTRLCALTIWELAAAYQEEDA